ncbi:MAG: polysaccharide deacetylase family protein [Spirochaetes bacterium]|nr:polysaccharide deacetylase family protein [Spirochaetota bacterium]
MADATHENKTPPAAYSRFKAFVFLSVLIFAILGGSWWLRERASAAAPQVMKTAVNPPQTLNTTPTTVGWKADIGVPVLCYHQIVTDEQYRAKPTPYAVTVKQLKEQIDWLAENNFYTILPDELLAYVRGEKKLDFSNGKRPIVITFDDGNNDFVNYAQKILDAHGYKGVLFIYPTYIMARKQRSMTWAEIQAVRKAGHAIESHTMWHPMLSTMSDAEQRAQFADSKKILDAKGGAQVRHLAYPFGVYTAASLKLLQETGYASAYTTFHGGNQVGENPYLLRRFLVVKGDNAKIFAQKTLARSLPLKLLNSQPGAVVEGAMQLKVGLPPELDDSAFKVRVFSTAQKFSYEPKTGTMTIELKPSKKRLSALEILYKEDGVEYRANALFNHRRDRVAKSAERKTRKKKHKKRRHTEDT